MLTRVFGVLAVVAAVAGAGSAQAVKRPAITGFAYVEFYESDVPAAKSFFAQRLGLPETDGAHETTDFAVGLKQHIEIAPLPSPAPASRLARIAFLTPDVHAMQRYLESKQVAVEAMGAHEIRLHDPEGNAVAFVSESRTAEERPTKMLAAGTPGAASSRRIIHAGWGVRSAAAEDAFYREVLGFRPYWHGGPKDDGKVEWSSLQVPEGTDWIEYMLAYSPSDGQRQLGVLNHVSLGVKDINDAAVQLEANGWTDAATRKVQMGRDGKMQLNVFDPDESRVEFMEFQPRAKPCCSDFTAASPTGDAE